MNALIEFKCECFANGVKYSAISSHKNAIDAAVNFAKRTDTIKNGYPVTNGILGVVEIKNIVSGKTIKCSVSMKKEATYYIKIDENLDLGTDVKLSDLIADQRDGETNEILDKLN